MALDTGHAATATFGTSALAYCWTEIDLGEETIPSVNTTCLSTTSYETMMPGDLKEPGTVTIPFLADAEDAVPTLGVAETLTVTLPTAVGGTSPATWVGTGFVTAFKRSRLVKNEVQDGSITFQFDGLTGPTFTAAT